MEAINKYYIDKAIDDFEAKYNAADNATQEKLINEIYNNFEMLPEEKKSELYDKLKIKGASQAAIKASMKTIGPSVILSSLIGLGGFASYTTLSSIIFGFSQIFGVTFSFGVYTGAASLLSFLTGPFMILLLIADGFFIYGQGKKQKADLVPLIVMQICICETSLNVHRNHQENYRRLVSLWKEKKKLFETKRDLENKLSSQMNGFIGNKNRLESEVSRESKELELLYEQFGVESNSFLRNTLMSSGKRGSMASYKDYNECIRKLESIQHNDRSNKGPFSKMVSKAKDTTQEYLLKKKMNDLENTLVAEAISSNYFVSETAVLRDILKRVTERKSMITNLKDKINYETKVINQGKGRLKDIQAELNEIKEEYLDISK
ncbi:MAG: hypothetical protein ABRQ24_03815 [Syntrophomonadaceae bacterium]